MNLLSRPSALLLVLLALPALAAKPLRAAEPLWSEGTPHPVIQPGAPLTFDAFSRIAARTAPAVVTIETEGDQATFRGFHPFLDRGTPREDFALGAGSGFIIRDDGHILSNNHVIEKAKTIKIHLHDGRIFEARLIGRDPATDLSLLKIDTPDKLPTVPLGDSDALQIGEWVVAIGNPMGLSHTVTVGIVSAKGRREVRPDDGLRYADFIQTDASINPGNSGGPLFNLQGEVIGINTAINAHAQGIGFSVPINMVKTVLPALKTRGLVERSWLGIQIGPVTAAHAKDAGLDRPQGALVSGVVRQGPAELAGLRAGDVILRFGDRPIERHDDLPWIASNAGIGETINLAIRREGHERKLTVTLGRMPGLEREPQR